jgi:hypothetical protein
VGLLWTALIPTAALTASADAAAARGDRHTVTSARASEGGDGAAVLPRPLRTWASAPASDLEAASADARVSAAGSADGPPSPSAASSATASTRASWAGSGAPLSPRVAVAATAGVPAAPLSPPPPPSSLSTASKLASLARNPDAVIFFATAAAFGVGVGAVDSWLFVLLDELDASRLLMSATLVVTVAAEVPVFFFAGRLIDRLGVTRVLHLVYAAFLIRLAGYAALPAFRTPWLVLPFETLNAVTFGAAFAAGTTACSRLAPPGLAATMQALFNASYSGVGYGGGSLVGGLVHARAGARWVFAAAGVIVACAWAATSAASAVVGRRRRGKG